MCLTFGGGSMRATFGCEFLSCDVMDNSRGEGNGDLGFRQNEIWLHTENRTYRLCQVARMGTMGWLEIAVIY